MLMCLFIPSIADRKRKCEIHPLGIGGNADPVRLVFNSAVGLYFASFANIEHVVIGKDTNLYR
jgi:L-arabinose isomerase